MVLELPRSGLAIARALESLLEPSSEVLLVLDLATPYLRDAWMNMSIASELVEQLSRRFSVSVLLGVLVDSWRSCLDRVPRELAAKAIDLDNLGWERIELSMYGRSVWIRVASPREPVVLATIPRTQPYPPIAYPSYLLAKYLTNPSDRWAIDADPRKLVVNVGIAMAKVIDRGYAILDLGKGVLCDGPIHGCVEDLRGPAVVGSVLEVDIYEHLYLGLEPPREYPWKRYVENTCIHRVWEGRVKLHSLARVFSRR